MDRIALIEQAKRKHLLQQATAKEAKAAVSGDQFSVYEEDPVANLSQEDQVTISSSTDQEAVEFAQATQFYNTRDSTNYPPEAVQAQISHEYGGDAKATDANEKNRKVLDWENRKKQEMEDYSARTSTFFKSPEVGRMVMESTRLRKEVPGRLGLMAPKEAVEHREQKLSEYEDYVKALPLEARIEIEQGEMKLEYGMLKRAWEGRDKSQMPETVRSRMDEIDSHLGITDTEFEGRVLSGRAKRFFDVFNFSRYSTHKEQQIAVDVNSDSKEMAQEKIERLHEMQDAANLTMPEGKRFGGKVWYGALGSAGPMGESIVADLATGGVAGKVYWATQGQGSVISDYVRDSGVNLKEISESEYTKLKHVSTATGVLYAATEYIGGVYGLQRAAPVKQSLQKLIKFAMTDDAIYKKLVQGGTKFAWEWLKENSEEGIQGFITEVGKQVIEGDVDTEEALVEGWTQFKEAAPATLGITLAGGGVSMAAKRKAWNKAVSEYVEKTTPDLIYDYGISQEKAEEVAISLANAKHERETRAIIQILKSETGQKLEVSRDKVMTLGDANRTRKQMTDQEIDSTVEQGAITAEQGEAIKAPEATREQMLDEANDALIQIEDEVPVPEGRTEEIEADPIDLGKEVDQSGTSIFADMTDSDLAEYVIDLREINAKASPDMVAELESRLDLDSARAKLFKDKIDSVSKQRGMGIVRKAEEAKTKPDIDLGNVEIISDKVSVVQSRGMKNFHEAFDFLGKLSGYRSEESLRARAKENAAKFEDMTEESAYNFLKTTAPIERRIALEKEFYTPVMAGDNKAVINLLEKNDFDLEGVFAKKMQAAVGAIILSEKIHQKEKSIQGKQVNRVEVKSQVKPEAVEKVEEAKERVDEPKSESLQRVENEAIVIEADLREKSNIKFLEGLTKEQQDAALRYAAFKTGYLEDSAPPLLEDLSPSAQEFFKEGQGWDVLAPQINVMLTGAKSALGIDYEGLAGYYFPMRHMADKEAAAQTTDDLLDASLGSTKHRTGTFNPSTMLSPADQINTYLSEVSNLIALSNEIAKQRAIVQENALDTAKALEKEKSGQELESREQWLIDKYADLRELEAVGVEHGYQVSATDDGQVFEWVMQLEEDGGGADPDALFKGRFGKNWIHAVDPSRVVVRMDDFEGVTPDGRIYGSNTKIYHQNISLAAEKKYQSQNATDAAKEAIRNRYGSLSKENIDKASDLLAKVFFSPLRSKAMRARSPSQISTELTLGQEDAKLVYDFSVRLRDAMNKIAMAPDFESDTSKVSREKRKRFFELSRKDQEGTITEPEQDELTRLNPEGNLARLARWTFEKTAISEKDFFGYLFSVETKALDTELFSMQYKKMHFWADYLESKGQEANAKWWRNYAEVGIKGQMYAWENKLLDGIANIASKKDHSELDRSIIKANMLESMNLLQRARINAWLGGNIGWSLVTQLGSITMTGKEAGYRKTAKAIFDVAFGSASFEGSETTRLKSKQRGFKSFEAVGEFQTERVGETKRQKLRNWMGFFASEEEKYLSGVSYVAGYRHGKDTLGLNEEQARIHGDLVAAETQSMYDRYTRNLALGSNVLRAAKPMQSFVYSKFSTIMQLLGKTGIDQSKKTRIERAAKWMLADATYAFLISLFWGDDPEKAILDPAYSKTGVGSGVPLVGKEVDQAIAGLLPWQEAMWAQKIPALRFLDKTGRMLEIPINPDQGHFGRELGLYSLDYITPMMGIPGSVPAKNLLKLYSAEQNDGIYEDIAGRKSWEYREKDSLMRWPMGIAFGSKAVDETEDQKKSKQKKTDKKQYGVHE